MIENIMKIKGVINSNATKKDDKYYLTINTTSENIMKNSKSLVYVEMEEFMFDAIKRFYKGNKIAMTGYVQAKKTKTDVPFIFFKCCSITLFAIPNKTKEIYIDMAHHKPKIEKQIQKNITKKIKKRLKLKDPWHTNFTEEDVVEIETSKIVLKASIHFRAHLLFSMSDYNPDKIIAVKKAEDDTYFLVVGFKDYVLAKALNKPTMKAIVTDYVHKRFKYKYILKRRPAKNKVEEINPEDIVNDSANTAEDTVKE